MEHLMSFHVAYKVILHAGCCETFGKCKSARTEDEPVFAFRYTARKIIQQLLYEITKVSKATVNWTARIFVRLRVAFTRDPRNWTNSSTANRTNS